MLSHSLLIESVPFALTGLKNYADQASHDFFSNRSSPAAANFYLRAFHYSSDAVNTKRCILYALLTREKDSTLKRYMWKYMGADCAATLREHILKTLNQDMTRMSQTEFLLSQLVNKTCDLNPLIKNLTTIIDNSSANDVSLLLQRTLDGIQVFLNKKPSKLTTLAKGFQALLLPQQYSDLGHLIILYALMSGHVETEFQKTIREHLMFGNTATLLSMITAKVKILHPYLCLPLSSNIATIQEDCKNNMDCSQVLYRYLKSPKSQLCP